MAGILFINCYISKSLIILCIPGFDTGTLTTSSAEWCYTRDTASLYYLVANGHELIQYFEADKVETNIVYGVRRIDGMDVDMENRMVYFVDGVQRKLMVSCLYRVCLMGISFYSSMIVSFIFIFFFVFLKRILCIVRGATSFIVLHLM